MAEQLLLDIETEIDHSTIWYVIVQCPVKTCRSVNCPSYHKEPDSPIRYHKCLDCGHNFKTIEAPLKKPEVLVN